MLSEETRDILSFVGEKTGELLGEEERYVYLFEEGSGPEIWEMVSQSSKFSEEHIEDTIEELIQKNLVEKKEVEETKNRLEGLVPSSSVWYKEENTRYIFDKELKKFIKNEEKIED